MTHWLYEGQPFDSDIIGDYVGFVYLITNLDNDKKYIGKKWFWSTKKLPPLKGKKRKRTVVKESDWKQYYGSSEEVKLLLEQLGKDNFKREILRLCKTKGECSYYELVEQIEREVLLKPDEYYNGIIQCKIHRSHILR